MKNIVVLFTLLVSFTLFAQKLTKSEVEKLPPTINNQFKKLYIKSGNYQQYKVVKKTSFLKLQKNINDSVRVFKNEILNKNKTIANQKDSIASLNNSFISLNEDLSIAKSKEDNIFIFGAQMQKKTYNLVLLSIIVILLIVLGLFIYKYLNSNTLTVEAKKQLQSVEEEFDAHRKRSIEKEQKLRRQLQDEINKSRGI